MRGVGQTHCSTLSTEHQPRRCQRAPGSGGPPPAWRPPRPSWELGRGGGSGPRPGSARCRLRRPARNGGGADAGGRRGRLPPAFSLLPATRRVWLARRGGLLRARGPGNAGLPLRAVRGEGPAARRAPSSWRPLRGAAVCQYVRGRCGCRCRCCPRPPPAAARRARRQVSNAAPLLAGRRCPAPGRSHGYRPVARRETSGWSGVSGAEGQRPCPRGARRQLARGPREPAARRGAEPARGAVLPPLAPHCLFTEPLLLVYLLPCSLMSFAAVRGLQSL